jgi:transposase
MWTEIIRPRYERSGRRYAGDATDAEWSHIAPLLPSAKPGGRPLDHGPELAGGECARGHARQRAYALRFHV